MKNITQTTKEFATRILETSEFIELQEATKQLDGSKEAQAILEAVEAKKQTVMTLQQTGLPVSDKQQQELQEAFEKMRANVICMRIIKAQNTAIQMARKISNQLTQETGIPFTSGGGCCG
jgi:cell fate (sporulation/competence/biofilm development) regulator YlbF (YheA/YmcA/DUF963 family)